MPFRSLISHSPKAVALVLGTLAFTAASAQALPATDVIASAGIHGVGDTSGLRPGVAAQGVDAAARATVAAQRPAPAAATSGVVLHRTGYAVGASDAAQRTSTAPAAIGVSDAAQRTAGEASDRVTVVRSLDRGFAVPKSAIAAPATPKVVVAADDADGFDWGTAGIGAGAVAALVLLAAGAMAPRPPRRRYAA